jgi:hypothetical protein
MTTNSAQIPIEGHLAGARTARGVPPWSHGSARKREHGDEHWPIGRDLEWYQRLSVGEHDETLVLTMQTVIPDAHATEEVRAGPYVTMLAELRRAG